MFRRINIYGASGVGKSTTAATIFAELKRERYKCEFVQEEAKLWAYQNKSIRGWDQWDVALSQMDKERILLEAGVDFIVTECPLLLNAFYGHKYKVPKYWLLRTQAELFEHKYPSINILLLMTDRPFETHGRFESQDESKQNEELLKEFLFEHKQFFISDMNHTEEILEYINRRITKYKD